MYRINLYREYQARRRRSRRRAAGKGLVVLLLGVELLLVGILAISGVLLREREAALRAGLTELTAGTASDRDAPAGLAAARQMLAIRAERIDWAPKLAALSSAIGPQLRLGEVTGHSAGGKTEARLRLEGVLLRSEGGMEAVAQFVEALREDSRMAGDFPRIALESLESGRVDHFAVTAERSGEGS